MRYKSTDTSKYAVAVYNQTSSLNGSMKVNMLASPGSGFLYKILIPKNRKNL